MTRSAHDEAVEAAARAVCSSLDACGRRPCDYFGGERPACCSRWKDYAPEATTAITAYLRHMRAAGFVVTRVPEEDAEHWGLTTWGLARAQGHNACRAEMLANAVEVPK